MKKMIRIVLSILLLSVALTSFQEQQVASQKKVSGLIQDARLAPEAVDFGGGKSGWKLAIPGNRPLATVAYGYGLIYFGGGYGSFEFYALDAVTGMVAWSFRTGDDGPTAAVIRNGLVAFNTESCIVYVLEAKTGKKVWEKWLGDPLMSMPAVDDHVVYMAYPGNDGSHYLACMELSTGHAKWRTPIKGDLISAPVLAGDSVYFSGLDGTVYRVSTASGKQIWAEQLNATCAPVIVGGQVIVSRRESDLSTPQSQKQREGLNTLEKDSGKQRENSLMASKEVPHFDVNRSTTKVMQQKVLDSNVGFANAPQSAKIEQAASNLGQTTVVGCWAYQGPRPVVTGGRSYNAVGNEVICLDIASGRKVWSKTLQSKEEGIGGRPLSPPSLANHKLFLGSGDGSVYCLSTRDGAILWQTKVGGAISFQPAVAKGIVYVSCDNGTLYAIRTGDPADDGWTMWGGSSGHNQ